MESTIRWHGNMNMPNENG